MKKLLTTLALTSTLVLSANATTTVNGWTKDQIINTFHLTSKSTAYQQCVAGAIVSNYNPVAYNIVKTSKNQKKIINMSNTALEVCGFNPDDKSLATYKENMDKQFHTYVKGFTHGTETINVEIPQISNYGKNQIKYFFTWYTPSGEEKNDIYYCYIGDRFGNGTSLNCESNY